MSEINLRKLFKETPYRVGSALGRPYIALGLEQAFRKTSKAKWVGLWFDDVEVVRNLIDVLKVIEKSMVEKKDAKS